MAFGNGTLKRINGNGWVVGIIANVITTTLAVGGLYWVLHEDVAIVKAQLAAARETIAEIRQSLKHEVASKAEVQAMWNQGQEQHARMWDAIRRDQRRGDGGE